MNQLMTIGELPATHSDKIMERLRIEAQERGRPAQRLATLDRLEEACNDIASGKASEFIRSAGQADPSLKEAYDNHYKRGVVAIKPPRIEEYVKARRIFDQRKGVKSAWTGPTSVTLRSEPDGMLAYVRKRETEQENLARKGKRSPALDDDIDQIADMSTRQRVRFALDDGREAKRQLNLLKQGLVKIPGIDVHAILEQHFDPAARSTSTTSALLSSGLTAADTQILRNLVARLTDVTTLASHELEYDGQRIKNKATNQALIEKPELAVLKRLAEGAEG